MMRALDGPVSTAVPDENTIVDTVEPAERVYSNING